MMALDIVIAMKHELMIGFIIFLLLFWKIRSDEPNPGMVISVVNGLLLATVLLFFCGSKEVMLFNNMFKENHIKFGYAYNFCHLLHLAQKQ